ncbi:MAG: Uma2 family endonuclease [Candidatus Sumerlaeaceae bacterium]
MSISPQAQLTSERKRRAFTVHEYHRMGETGVLTPEDRTELIDGDIVQMTPMGSRHAGIVATLNKYFVEQAKERYILFPQLPVRLGTFSEPQPDLLLLKARKDFYTSALPTSQDVLLIIEVSESSLKFDHSVKIPLYAKHGVKEVWIIDAGAGKVEVYRKPGKMGYLEVRTYKRGDSITLSQIKGMNVAVSEFLKK